MHVVVTVLCLVAVVFGLACLMAREVDDDHEGDEL